METTQYESKQLNNLLDIIHFTETISTRLYELDDEAEILAAIKEMFAQSKQYTTVILKLNDDKSALQIVEASIPTEKLRAAERMGNFHMDQISIELENSKILSRVVYNQETVHFNIRDLVCEIFPKLLVTLIWKVAGFRDRWGMVTPLKKHGKVIGAFSVSCPELVEEFFPTIKSFAQHISRALELASERAEREHVEQALQGSVKRFRSLFEQSNDAIFIHDFKGKLFDANQAAIELLGFPLDDLMQLPISALHPEEEMEASKDAFETTMKKGFVRFDSKLKRVDGTVIDVEISSRIVNHERGIIQGIVRDISKRKQTEKELNSINEELRLVLDTVPAIIWYKDTNNNIVRVNKAAAKSVGLSIKDIEGKHTSDLFPEEAEKYYRDDLKVFRSGKPKYGIIEPLKTSTGEVKWVKTDKVPLSNNRGDISGLIAFATDITQLKNTQEEKEKLKEQLHQGEKLRAVGELAGGIAHDFNNMLGAISGYADLIEESNRDTQGNVKDTELDKRVSVISRASNRAADLVAKLLAFSRRGKFRNVPINVHEIVHDAVTLLERGIDRKILIEKVFSANNAVIKGDSSQIQNAILNIAMNACDAMKDGGVLTLHTSNETLRDGQFHQDIKAGDYIVVSVKDTGIGINPDMLSRIFEPFFTTKEVGEGTGLGLSSALGTMQSHDGYITVESTKEVGTVFTIYLRLAQQKRSVKSEKEKGKLKKGSGSILIIDDEDMIRDMAQEILKRSGYTVHAFGDSVEALSWYERNYLTIDLVLLDMIMPKMDGLDCFDKMKEINTDVKVVLVSGFSRNNKVQKMMQMGVLDFIEKPFDGILLSDIISRALKNGRSVGKKKDKK